MIGGLAYDTSHGQVKARGHVLDEKYIQTIAPDVQSILKDDVGVQEIKDALLGLVETEFGNTTLSQLLAPPTSFEEWRVGEALAEHHLVTHVGCQFPWPDSRSTRNPNSSSGGVDLIGFQVAATTRFVFAEVKTSHEKAWPPRLLTSRSHGLQTQLAGLIAGDDRSEWAIRYLSMNSIGRPWFHTFKDAMRTYLKDKLDIAIFGVLIHATDPQVNDLKDRAKNLAPLAVAPCSVALIAIYLSAELLVEAAAAPIAVETT